MASYNKGNKMKNKIELNEYGMQDFNEELTASLRPYLPEQTTAVSFGNKNVVYIGDEYTNFYGMDVMVESISDSGCICRVYPLHSLVDGSKWSMPEDDKIIRVCASVLGKYKAVSNRYLKLMRITAEEHLFEEYGVVYDA